MGRFLYRGGIIFLFVLVPLGMSSFGRDAYFLKYFLWLTGICCLLGLDTGSRGRFILPITVLCLSPGLSTLSSWYPDLACARLMLLFSGGLTVILVARTFREEHSNFLLTALVLTSGLVSTYGILERFGFEFLEWKSGITSTFGNPNFFSDYLVMILPATCYAVFRMRRRRAVVLLVLVMAVYCLVLARSRGAYIAFAVQVTIGSLVLIARRSEFSRTRMRTGVVLGICLLLGIGAGWQTFLAEIETFRTIFRGGFEVRIPLWRGTADIIRAYPFTGIGPDNFQSVYGEFRLPEERGFSGINLVRHSHNDYLQTAAETGLPGLIILVGFFIAVIVTGLRSRSGLRVSFAIGLIGLGVTAAFSFPLYVETTLVYTFLFPGIIIAPYRTETKSIHTNRTRVGLAVLLLLISTLSLIRPFASSAYLKMGLALKNSGNYREAASVLDRADKLYKGEVLSVYNRGESILQEGIQSGDKELLEKAEKSLETAILRSPFDPAYRNNLAVALFYQKKFSAAAAAYISSLRVYPEGNPDAVNGLTSCYISLGADLMGRNDLPGSEYFFLKAYRINPENVTVLHNLGYLYQTQGNYDRAILFYRKAIERDPSLQDDYVSLGELYRERGEHQAAIGMYGKALELSENTPAWNHARTRLLQYRKLQDGSRR